MSAATVQLQPPLLQLREQIRQLYLTTTGQDEANAMVSILEQYYLQADEALSRGIVHVHTANQSLHAMMTLLLNCQEDQQVNCEQIVALLEPIRQELQAGFVQISEVM
ncbi:hypothetical protein [Chromobacterium haemolyticum]|uniref:hypothetical protein n=1 Tax=Chromobacterium haemolyticum TaxID=394935 RepID=UPI0009D9301D|nr:hypothetical protein [Chromobacterium haemolyticum]OQS35927.1 hypothetical protein B0T39_17295 [Chromobacterium haemolyticum]